jgi:hypothetical protein
MATPDLHALCDQPAFLRGHYSGALIRCRSRQALILVESTAPGEAGLREPSILRATQNNSSRCWKSDTVLTHRLAQAADSGES